MKSTALLFSSSPDNNNFGQDYLDITIAISLMTAKTGIFFIGDGVFYLIKKKEFESIQHKNYIFPLKLLLTYGIDQFYSCNIFFKDRGLNVHTNSFLIDLVFLDVNSLTQKINSFDVILKF